MAMIVFVVGLPGSGKTLYARERAEREGRILVDDPRDAEALCHMEALVAGGRSIIVTDPNLCFPDVRELAAGRFAGQTVEWVYFENDPERCLYNSTGRGRQVEGFIRLASKYYQIPEGGQVRPVWRP